MSFSYRGVIPASKSLMNRALICASYGNNISLHGNSSCDDVVKMQQAIAALVHQRAEIPSSKNKINSIYDCGAAGTVFRFLALRLSRLPGVHTLKGTKRLLLRPQQDLLDLLLRLGVQYQLTSEAMIITSEGWKNLTEPIVVQRGVSSQFASGLLLNAWELNQDLVLQQEGNPISEGYFDMTIQMVKTLGMKLEASASSPSSLIVRAQSQITAREYQIESDLSSAFAIASFAALNGKALFEQFPNPSLQPDFEFISILKNMGIPVELTSNHLEVTKPSYFKGGEANLKSCPDLFPVLATLCAFAQSPSKLYGAPQLIHKESNRIEKVAELLNKINIKNEKTSDGMVIHPSPSRESVSPFTYDTDHDHRLAFAAALVKSQGYPITIEHPEVVAKSFPEFWDTIKL